MNIQCFFFNFKTYHPYWETLYFWFDQLHLHYFDFCIKHPALFRETYYFINTIINSQPTTEWLKLPNHFFQCNSQWKTYSCCLQWIVTANQWPFTDSGLESMKRFFFHILISYIKVALILAMLEFFRFQLLKTISMQLRGKFWKVLVHNDRYYT